jgi:hypothetical protein
MDHSKQPLAKRFKDAHIEKTLVMAKERLCMVERLLKEFLSAISNIKQESVANGIPIILECGSTMLKVHSLLVAVALLQKLNSGQAEKWQFFVRARNNKDCTHVFNDEIATSMYKDPFAFMSVFAFYPVGVSKDDIREDRGIYE